MRSAATKKRRPLLFAAAIVAATALTTPPAEATRYLPDLTSAQAQPALPTLETLNQVALDPPADEVTPRHILIDDEVYALLSLLPLVDDHECSKLLADKQFHPLTDAYSGPLRRAVERVWAEKLASGVQNSSETRNHLVDK